MKVFLVLLTGISLWTYPLMAKFSQFPFIQDKTTMSMDPTHPTITIDPGVSVEAYAWVSGGGAVRDGEEKLVEKEHIYELDTTKYGLTQSTFLNYYKKIIVKNPYGRTHSDWDSHHKEYRNDFTFDITKAGEYMFYEWSGTGGSMFASAKGRVKWEWNGNTLKIKFWATAYAWHHSFGGYDADSRSTFIVNQMDVVSNAESESTTYSRVKNALEKKLSFASDYSGSLEDERNIYDPKGQGNDLTTAMNKVLKQGFGKEYSYWEKFIRPFSFSDAKHEITTVIAFNRLSTGEAVTWTFKTPVAISLSGNYWGKQLKERLNIIPGKVVDQFDPLNGMVEDKPILAPDSPPITDTYGGKWQYHTTASVQFDALVPGTPNYGNEYLKVNGIKVPVLDYKFNYKMEDLRNNDKDSKENNLYQVEIIHESGNQNVSYKIDYEINNLVPELSIQWYAWNPKENKDQKELITPTIDGKPNPKYDPEINPETGTKSQIVWVKRKTDHNFPFDPLNEKGEVIKNKAEYDLGYIVEGTAVSMGIRQIFDAPEIANVAREQVGDDLKGNNPNSITGKMQQIPSDQEGHYLSETGKWHYITKTNDQLTYEKYAIIGKNGFDNYPRFLDIMNNPDLVVNFWTTIHGKHLKNFLITYKNLNSKEIFALTYEQVVSYWKEYTSDIMAQKIPAIPEPDNYYKLEKNLPIVKMNEHELGEIVRIIKAEVAEFITSKVPKAVYTIDYKIYNKDHIDITENNSVLADLLNNAEQPQYMNLFVEASPTSTLLIGTAKVEVKNSKNYDPNNVYNLSKVRFRNQSYNFADFSPSQLRIWIEEWVAKGISVYQYPITLNADYGISANGIPDEDPISHNNTPGDLNDAILTEFIDNTEHNKEL